MLCKCQENAEAKCQFFVGFIVCFKQKIIRWEMQINKCHENTQNKPYYLIYASIFSRPTNRTHVICWIKKAQILR
ncbi:hypothetical protein GNIT_2304 [Glaciecola nitratireducens FR1064]|uniref:Uncharacterized protein n=1 Tax=Glaciecola nitratireducens (strain JCM 12485 / KCTC 12276 / FR1064) TaxID=1085623 RepID=G4QKV1_GLANF|nr:hypothetical protein GNIT_2304 [Glaciecola nitratireducens FR1064]